jgi:YidC/Oxa1 family membrane protein insertase
MNKRPLLFVIAISLSLFALNQYFDWQNKQRRTELVAQIRQKDEETLQKNALALREKVATADQLPIVKLYTDSGQSSFASLAVQQDDHFLTIAWKTSLPQVVYSGGKELALQSKNPSLGMPVLYSMQTDAGLCPSLCFASPPLSGTTDLQLLYFSNENSHANVTLGVLEDGRFIGAIDHPSSPCIALFKTEGHYLPYGIYQPSALAFDLLSKQPMLAKGMEMSAVERGIQKKIPGEQFYVLENPYLQVVFSNAGGSVAEINLPFQSNENKNSLVLPINVDRELIKEQSPNEHFPLNPYYRAGSTKLNEPKNGGYYPLLRRSLLNKGGDPLSVASPRYYALNLLPSANSSNTRASEGIYKLKRFESNLVEFELSDGNRKITKTYTFPRDADNAPYSFELTLQCQGDVQGLELNSGVPEVELISDSFSPSLKYLPIATQKKSSVVQISLPKEMETIHDVSPEWLSNGNGFFGIIINPASKPSQTFSAYRIPGDAVPTRLSLVDAQYQLYPATKYPGYEFRLPIDTGTAMQKYRIFAGPYVKEVLEKLDAAYFNAATGGSPRFESAISFHGWFSFISEPFAKFLFLLMRFFYFITSSWGISIILLTIALRIMLYPLNTWSIRSTLKMQEIAPQVQAIQARYKKDPKRAQMEVIHLYREKGINPLSGCFPLLIQLPFLIGMFDLLKSTFELRGVSFIPGWIDNLTAPDVLFSWGYPIFFIGNEFHLLPILLGGVMYLQQRYSSSTNANRNMPMTDQQRQQKFMGNIMTIVFMFMFYNFPSGLNIYWLSSMLLGILQQWIMTRKKHSKPIVEVLK